MNSLQQSLEGSFSSASSANMQSDNPKMKFMDAVMQENIRAVFEMIDCNESTELMTDSEVRNMKKLQGKSLPPAGIQAPSEGPFISGNQ